MSFQDLKRKSGSRNPRRRVLIVCEGKTEVCYFEELSRRVKFPGTVLVSVESDHPQPDQVVKYAKKIKANAAKPSSSTTPFDEVWCVIDGDNREKLREARSEAQKSGIRLAITNPCFEYWILLHFEDCGKAFSNCDKAGEYLKKRGHAPEYAKNNSDFRKIVPNFNAAVSNSEKRRRIGELPESQNPCSDLHLLLNILK